MQTMDQGKTGWWIGGGLVALALVVGFLLINSFADAREAEDMGRWRDRMEIVADSRAADASAWLNRYLAQVEEIAADPTVELYAAGLMGIDDPAVVEAQRNYVLNYLSAEADRSGFHEQRALDPVNANVKRPQRAGLGLLSVNGGAPLVATRGMPSLAGHDWREGRTGSFIALGPQLEDKTPLVLFAAPVKAPEGAAARLTAAWVIGARPLDEDFLATLKQPGDATRTAETYLAMPAGANGPDTVISLTPLAGGGRVGEVRRDAAASFAIATPGGFATLAGYTGEKVLVTGRELTAPVPWILVHTISASEAMADIEARRTSLEITLGITGIALLVVLVLVWRYGVSQRLMAAYRTQAALSTENELLSQFLQHVSDAQPTAIAALADDGTVRFVNRGMTTLVGLDRDDMIDRQFLPVFNRDTARILGDGITHALAGDSSQALVTHTLGGEPRHFQVDFVAVDDSSQGTSTLVVMQDITDLIRAHERSEALLGQLIGVLTNIIDSRDPFSRHHSARVAKVAEAIGAELGWDDVRLKAVSIAGRLVNIGKIFVPISVLTKESPLDAAELALVRDSIRKGAALLKDLDFEGPVYRSLAELQAHMDGSGEPAGLSGDAIEPAARVLAVANAFIAMVSARAHRGGLGFDKAMTLLMEEAGKRYDRKAVAALQNVLENKGGREDWAGFGEVPGSDA
ncbi:HD domain-containing phosphohydrolase [Pseudokordiimonas caeni]|uniref:HD domain-containing phosphohydrolase n=1 Tax=Pseudokordiimonas caeni TaxID=2997908 RepID=UPI00281228F2|nr:HD domain-containing phosphohydrolase [Pseudokordiimonas caeni]